MVMATFVLTHCEAGASGNDATGCWQGADRATGEQTRPDYRPAIPSSGLLAEAYTFCGIRPARYAARPASTPSLNAFAISAGSCACAMAVLTSTASAPI